MDAAQLGVIFDWDGVIIDSHDQHEESWFRLAAEEGREFTRELFRESFGMRNEDTLIRVLGWLSAGDRDGVKRLGERKEVLYRDILREDGIEPLPGVRELLTMLKQAGVPCAVGTSTPVENVETVVRLTGLDDAWFAGVCAAGDVRQGKPAPDVFLEAARRIGRAPGHCVVFEDAPVGIQAARRAGMKVVAVTTTHPAEALNDADRVVNSLEEVSLERLLALWRPAAKVTANDQ